MAVLQLSYLYFCSVSLEQHTVLSARALYALEEKNSPVCLFTALMSECRQHQYKING